MHVRYRTLCIFCVGIKDVGDTFVHQKLLVHWHLQFLDFAVRAEDFAQVPFVDILCELFDDDLSRLWNRWATRPRHTAGVASFAVGFAVSAVSASRQPLPYLLGVRARYRDGLRDLVLVRFLLLSNSCASSYRS